MATVAKAPISNFICDDEYLCAGEIEARFEIPARQTLAAHRRRELKAGHVRPSGTPEMVGLPGLAVRQWIEKHRVEYSITQHAHNCRDSIRKTAARKAQQASSKAATGKPAKPSALDVLNPDSWYAVDTVAAWFAGVNADMILAAARSGELRQFFGALPDCRVKGASLIAWLGRQDDRLKLSSAGVDERQRLLRGKPGSAGKVLAEEDEPKSLLDSAAAIEDRAERQQQILAEQQYTDRWAKLICLLRKDVAGNVDKEDAGLLIKLRTDLFLSQERIRLLRGVIIEVQPLIKQHDDLAAAHARLVTARDALKKLADRHIAEMHEVESAYNTADAEHRASKNAGQKIVMLSRSAPEVFDTSTDSPRLMSGNPVDAVDLQGNSRKPHRKNGATD